MSNDKTFVENRYKSEATEKFCRLHNPFLTDRLKNIAVFGIEHNPNPKVGGSDFLLSYAREMFEAPISDPFKYLTSSCCPLKDGDQWIGQLAQDGKRIVNLYPLRKDEYGYWDILGAPGTLIRGDGEAKGEHDNSFLTRGLKMQENDGGYCVDADGNRYHAPWGTLHFEMWDGSHYGNLYGYLYPAEHTRQTKMLYKRPTVFYYVLTLPDENGEEYGEDVFCVLAFNFDALAKRLEEIAKEMGIFTLNPWTVHKKNDYGRADLYGKMWHVPIEKFKPLYENGDMAVTMVGDDPACPSDYRDEWQRKLFRDRLQTLRGYAKGVRIEELSPEYLAFVKKRQEERKAEKADIWNNL